MKRFFRLCGCLILLMSLSGCWNSKVIQDMSYVTALGIDYVNEEYICYGQVLNFSGLAKGEGAGSALSKRTPLWIAIGKGRSFTEAITDMYDSAQLRIFWGHIKALVFSEGVLKKGISNIFDMLNRYREIRYNIWVYGTNKPILDILVTQSILNLSPNDTILESPEDVHSQSSAIPPLYMYRLISDIDEPAKTVFLPSISLNNTDWKEDKKSKTMLVGNGAYFIQGDKMSGWLSFEDLKGAIWMETKTKRVPSVIPKINKPIASLVLVNPRHKIKPIIKDNKVHFDIELKVNAYVDELHQNHTEKTIQEHTEKLIKDEIMDSFKRGLKIKEDVLQLDVVLYRKYPQEWHKLHRKDRFILKEDSIQSLDVKVKILHSGKYKLRVK